MVASQEHWSRINVSPPSLQSDKYRSKVWVDSCFVSSHIFVPSVWGSNEAPFSRYSRNRWYWKTWNFPLIMFFNASSRVVAIGLVSISSSKKRRSTVGLLLFNSSVCRKASIYCNVASGTASSITHAGPCWVSIKRTFAIDDDDEMMFHASVIMVCGFEGWKMQLTTGRRRLKVSFRQVD